MWPPCLMNRRILAPGGAPEPAIAPPTLVVWSTLRKAARTPSPPEVGSALGGPTGSDKLPGSESDAQLLARAVAELVRRTRFPVAFGGLEHGDAIHVTSIVGARTRSLEGLVVQASRGLGGRALVEKRPRLALDYRMARSITHDYDRAVLGEGISTLFAVPVLVGSRARGVIYCGSWAEAPVGDVVARPAFAVVVLA